MISPVSAQPDSAASITYVSSSSPARAPPLLDVLHDLNHVISRTHRETRSLDALARRFYTVTNAYWNAVQAALPEALDGSRRGLLQYLNRYLCGRALMVFTSLFRCAFKGMYRVFPSQDVQVVSSQPSCLLLTQHVKSSTPASITRCPCSALSECPSSMASHGI